MSSFPKFSITIPAYKSKFLSEAVASCIAQTYHNFEVVIVDDNSPEDLLSILKPYLTDVRVRYYRNEKNCGAYNVVDNWNICLGYCQGDYIICMGDDDRLLPCCLAEYVKIMQKFPYLGVYHTWTEIIDENGDFYDIQHPRPLFESSYSLIWNRWNGRTKQYIGDFCFDIQMLRNDGGFYKLPMAWGSDDISVTRAANHAGIANTQVLGFQYRHNRLSITQSGTRKTKVEASLLEKEWFTLFLKNKPTKQLDYYYWKLLCNSIDIYFKKKVRGQIASDMSEHKIHLIYWLRKRKVLHINFRTVIEAFVYSFII